MSALAPLLCIRRRRPAHTEDASSDAEVMTQLRIKVIFLLWSSVRTMSSKGIVGIVAGSPVKELCVLPTP